MLIFSALIIYNYYWNKAHIENFDWYTPYLISIFIFYGIYKFFQVTSLKDKIEFSPFIIFTYFILHLWLSSILFFSYSGELFWSALWNWISLLFKIFFYSILPLLILYISTSFGQFSLSKILSNYKEKSVNYRLITWISFWIFLFIFILTVVWMLGFYNIYSVFAILILFSTLWYKRLINNIKSTFTYKIKCTNHNIYSDKLLEKINPTLLSTEFFFIIITLLLSVNLISIFRPFPIGWDDLWAYMNFPHLMANEWSVWFLGSMMSWQTFTWIGYIFENPTLAFFLNNVGGFISVIIITLIVTEIFKNSKKTFINLWLLASTLFISMPMVVFQQAKDMKLDAGLFFISITALYMLFEFFNGYTSPLTPLLKRGEGDNKKLLSKTEIIKLFWVVWLLLGFAFTIKFTSLLLISAIIGLLFFTRLWILGFLWYLSIYFAIFTAGWLWSKMNVVMPTTHDFKIESWVIWLIIWIAFLTTARVKTKKRFRRFIPRILALLVWILIAISPWAINNINQANKIWENEMLSWKSEHFIVDYSKIYSKKELDKIEKSTSLRWITDSWTTSNEDFGRYFGYEEGINNYIKLPWNLTMQSNQWWEFTNIWFLFLALLPVLLLFLPFRKQYFSLWVYALLFFEILLFVMPWTNALITQFLASFELPFWYILILLLFLLPLVFLIPTVQQKSLEKLFKINLVFTIFYVFLWSISAFGIVWYWIVMYFNLILMIVFWAYYLWSYKDDWKNNVEMSGKNIWEWQEKQIKFFGTLVFLTIIWIWIFVSVFPHTFINLKNAGYKEYKQWKINAVEAPYLYHKEYLNILFNLNIAENKRKELIEKSLEWKEIIKIYNENKKVLWNDISKILWLLRQILIKENINIKTKLLAKKSIQNLYSEISNPNKIYRSNAGIYRIWTFLKYHISQNNKRLYWDSLLDKFDKYFYDINSDVTVERMKNFGLKFLLVDLNAATIDKDPRHALTTRYEKLLQTFTSDKLELIETDSVCLKIWLENYNNVIWKVKSKKDIEVYISLAGVNYDSYNSEWKRYWRLNKQMNCYKWILQLFNANQINNNHYNYLLQLKPYLNKLKTEEQKIQFLHNNLGHWFKVLFKIK